MFYGFLGHNIIEILPKLQERKTLKNQAITNALLLDMDKKIGVLESGYLADIIATNDDPTTNVNTVIDVIFVMKEGVQYK